VKYEITLGHPIRDHVVSQYDTGLSLRRAGFINVRWYMGSGRKNGDYLHTWSCEGDSESIMILKLSADVERIKLVEKS
jgi:hypothetical protein